MNRRDGRGALILGLASSLVGCRWPSASPDFLPTDIDFGNVPVGSSTVLTNQLLIQNAGSNTANLVSGSFGGANPGDFTLLTALPSLLKAGEGVSVSLSFAPSATGPRSATVTVNTTDPSGTAFVSTLQGVGAQYAVCPVPPALDFGNVQVLGTPATTSVQLNNCGFSPATVTFALPTLEGLNVRDYTLSGPVGSTVIPPGGGITLTVSFSPAGVGGSAADFRFTACDACPGQFVDLSGVGTDCQIKFTPDPVSFASGPTQQVTVTNVGQAECDIESLGADTGVTVTSSPPLPLELAIGQEFVVPVAMQNVSGSPPGSALVVTYTVTDPAVPARTASDPAVSN
jgi:hypothetical protein